MISGEQGLALNLQAIRDYLRENFPADKHDDENDFERCRHKFRIITDDQILLLSISSEFVEDSDSETIIRRLKFLRVIDLLKTNPKSTIVVWQHGAQGSVSVDPRI
ncbi:MAG: hypothetical protein AABZ15_02815 [Nitrospirota bacterium]